MKPPLGSRRSPIPTRVHYELDGDYEALYKPPRNQGSRPATPLPQQPRGRRPRSPRSIDERSDRAHYYDQPLQPMRRDMGYPGMYYGYYPYPMMPPPRHADYGYYPHYDTIHGGQYGASPHPQDPRRASYDKYEERDNRIDSESRASNADSRRIASPTSQSSRSRGSRSRGSRSRGSQSNRAASATSSRSGRSRQIGASSPMSQSQGRDEFDDASWAIQRASSTFSLDSRISNPQLLHARELPELPSGYLQRKDGVVFSVASSMASRDTFERYADVMEHPEEAADRVVEHLKSRGYNFDDQDGVLGSYSGSYDLPRYGGYPSQSISGSEKEGSIPRRTGSTTANSTASKARSLQSEVTNLGVMCPPGVEFRAKVKTGRGSPFQNANKDSMYRAKILRTPLFDGSSHGSTRSSYGVSRPPRHTESTGSRSRRNPDRASPSFNQQQQLGGILRNSPTPMEMKARALWDSSTKGSATKSPSTIIERSSTRDAVATVSHSPGQDSYIFEAGTILEDEETPRTFDPSRNHPRNYARQGSAEAPPGNSVPGSVSNQATATANAALTHVDNSSVVSGLTQQKSFGETTISSVTFQNNPADPIESMLERLLFSCRISTCPQS